MGQVILGIDIGGSAVKGNLVDIAKGRPLAERHKIPTPQPSTPRAVAATVAEMVRHFDYSGPVGCTFPAVVKNGVTHSAANVDQEWIGTDADALFEETTGLSFRMLNDADAAAIAESSFGAAQGRGGVVLVLTFGTGIGSGLLVDGSLVPNTELGHLHLDGHAPVERWCSARAKVEEGLSWEEWGLRVDRYLDHLALILSPDLFVIGGGVSREFSEFAPYLSGEVEVLPAALRNEAGIVGAAVVAASA